MEDTTPHSPPHGHGDDSSTSRLSSPDSPTSLTTPRFLPHEISRLIQCSRCSLPFRTPLRLPCGNTLCRSCLPPIRPRTEVSYPASEERKQGFTCYWGAWECGADHCLGDCGSDVLLTKLVEVFDEVLGDDRMAGEDAGLVTLTWSPGKEEEIGLGSADISPDLLRGVYGLVKRGRFRYDASEIRYELSVHADFATTDRTFERLKAAVRSEVDCQVCYSLITDPLTTPCGHTFCRSCVAMAMAHSNLCPICRRKLNITSAVRLERVNKTLSDLIDLFWPDEVASRRADLASDIDAGTGGKIPLAVVGLSFPTMPIALHIFEPRYRLMIKRVMESRSRKFGIVMSNRQGRFQGGLGRSPLMQYGTILAIDRYEPLRDGRSLVIATGMSRFKVLSWELVDDYHVGNIERVDDVSISEEEAQESRETSAAIHSITSTSGTVEPSLESMSTQQLFQLALDFVLKERRRGAAWLHPRVTLAYGSLPTDPALFPWWFATILPIWNEEKYALLSTTTVRQRLKITARWIKKLESRQWFSRPRPSISAVL